MLQFRLTLMKACGALILKQKGAESVVQQSKKNQLVRPARVR